MQAKRRTPQKLQVDRYLRRGEDKHVSDEALRELGTLDVRLSANPKDADALVARAEILRDLRQFTLALADANAALAINNKSAAAHFEAAENLDGLDRQKGALLHVRIATELDPQIQTLVLSRRTRTPARRLRRSRYIADALN